MAFTPITTSEVDAKSPLDTVLHGKIKDNFDDHEGRILALEVGGGAGGAGAQYGDVYAAEKINVASGKIKALTLSQKKVLKIASDDSYLDINEGAGEISVKVLSANQIFFLHDLDYENESEDAYNLTKIIQDALNASSLTLTYTVSYDSVSRKVTIAATSNFNLLFNTGTNALHSLGIALGYDVTTDKTLASSHTAENEIDDENNTVLIPIACVSKCDASSVIKGENFTGVADITFNKGAIVTVKQYQHIANLTGLEAGKEYYTMGGKIVIDDSNKFINFKEGGGSELTATIVKGNYYRGGDASIAYSELCGAIKNALETAGTLTYNIWFDKNENKFTIKTASGTVQFLWKTGANGSDNTDTHAGTILGWDDSQDTISQQTNTSDNIIPTDTGQIATADDEKLDINSKYVGFATKDDGTKLFTEMNHSLSFYGPIARAQKDWFAEPTIKDYSRKICLSDQSENATGKGIRLFIHLNAAPYVIRAQYKLGHGMPWLDSNWTHTIALTPGDYFSGISYQISAKCFVSDKGKLVIAIGDAGGSAPLAAYSSNGDFKDGIALVSSSLASSYIYDIQIDINEDVAVIASTDGSQNDRFWRSLDSGSGFTGFTQISIGRKRSRDNAGTSLTNPVFVQYFPNETWPNNYRLVSVRNNTSTGTIECSHWRGDGTSEVTQTIAGGYLYLNAERKNNLLVITHNNFGSPHQIYQAESNTDYNAHVLNWNKHGSININSTGLNPSLQGGYSSANILHPRHSYIRSAIVGNAFYTVFELVSGGKVQPYLFYNKNVISGSFETPINIGWNTGINYQESCLFHLPEINGLVFMAKILPTAALSANLSNGIIYARYIQILQNGDLSLYEPVDISGGKSESGFAGFLYGSASNRNVNASWLQTDAYDRPRANRYY